MQDGLTHFLRFVAPSTARPVGFSHRLALTFGMVTTRTKSNAKPRETVSALAPAIHSKTSTVTVPASKTPPSDLPTQTFSCAADFETFLEENHNTLPGLYVKLAKKASGIPSISGAEAVETALCFGWIDGVAKGIDDHWWTVRYTPRRNKSIWSQKNVNTATRLQNEGRMRQAGIAAVEAAKADGRWAKAYAGPKDIVEPEDFVQILRQNEAARAFFQTLNKRDRYAVLWRIETASQKARQGRIQALTDGLAVGKIPGRDSKVGEETPASQHRKSKAMSIAKGKKIAVTTPSGRSKQVAALKNEENRTQLLGHSKVRKANKAK